MYQAHWEATEVFDGPMGDLIGQLTMLGFHGLALGLILFITAQLKGQTLLIPMILGLLILEFLFVVTRASRQNIVLLLLILLMTRHYFKRRIPASRLIFSALLFAVFLFPLTEQWRKVYWKSAQPETPGAATSYLIAFQRLREAETAGEYLQTAVTVFSNRLHGMDSLMVCLYKTPAVIPFYRGETLRNTLIGAFIPRFLWLEKPIVIFSDIFAKPYWGLPPGVKTAIAVSQIGELYINYGLTGILAGMFLLGALYRLLYAYLVLQWPRSLAVFIYIFVFFNLIIIDREFAIAYGALLKQLLLLIVVCAFVSRRPQVTGGAG
jgi:hypothetical protein